MKNEKVSDKYYAIFKQTGYSEIAEFPTKELRDEWVNHEDEFSQICGITNENAYLDRKPADADLVKHILEKDSYYTEPDRALAYITWYYSQ